jgi:branched-chain amino acid transport system substrate-binding protein
LQIGHAAAAFSIAGLAAADPIKIGVAGPFTGGSSSLRAQRDGVRMAADENKKAGGGVLGRKLELVERDDESQERARRSNRPRADQQGKSHRHRGLHQHRRGAMSQRFFQEAKIPVMNNGHGQPDHPAVQDEPELHFRNAAHDSIQAPMIVEEAVTHVAASRKSPSWPTLHLN